MKHTTTGEETLKKHRFCLGSLLGCFCVFLLSKHPAGPGGPKLDEKTENEIALVATSNLIEFGGENVLNFKIS